MTVIDQLAAEYSRLCGRLGVHRVLNTSPQHDGSPHVEYFGGHYHYVITERGSEWKRQITSDKEELLFWLLRDVAFELACAFELRNRIEGQDFRRILFSKEIELMGQLRPEWGVHARAKIEEVLRRVPYRDEKS